MAETVALVALAAGTAVSAYGSVRQGQATAKAAQAAAQLNEIQAQQADQQSQREAQAFRRRFAIEQGANIASAGAAGLSMSGSTLSLFEQNFAEGELEAANIRYNGLVQKSNAITSASMNRAMGSNARTAGYISAAGTVLQGAGTIGASRSSGGSSGGGSSGASAGA